jgi:hypothetical protein
MASREPGSSSLAIRVHTAHPGLHTDIVLPGLRGPRPGGLVDEKVPGRAPQATAADPAPPLDDPAVESLVLRLLEAQRPMLIAVEGTRPGRDLLVRAAERFGIGVCTTGGRTPSLTTTPTSWGTSASWCRTAPSSTSSRGRAQSRGAATSTS